eukprot:g81457.t1
MVFMCAAMRIVPCQVPCPSYSTNFHLLSALHLYLCLTHSSVYTLTRNHYNRIVYDSDMAGHDPVPRSHGGNCDCRCDRGQERDSQDFKIISAVGSGFAYFRVVRDVLQTIGCGVQGEINLHFDTYSLVRLLLAGRQQQGIIHIVYFEVLDSLQPTIPTECILFTTPPVNNQTERVEQKNKAGDEAPDEEIEEAEEEEQSQSHENTDIILSDSPTHDTEQPQHSESEQQDELSLEQSMRDDSYKQVSLGPTPNSDFTAPDADYTDP